MELLYRLELKRRKALSFYHTDWALRILSHALFQVYHRLSLLYGLGVLQYSVKETFMTFTLTIQNQSRTFDAPVRLDHLIDDPEHRYFLASVNGRLFELSARIDYDATVTFLDVTDDEAVYTYEASLRYLVAMALYQLYPEATFKFYFSVSRGVYLEFTENAPKLTLKAIKRHIESHMDALIAADLPIERITLPKADAKKQYETYRFKDKTKTLAYRPEDTVHLYQCDGYINYMYHHMVPSTGYLKLYRLTMEHPGLIIEGPRAEFNGLIPDYQPEPVFKELLKEANRRGSRLKSESVTEVNERTVSDAKTFIQDSEAEHKEALNAIVDHLDVFDEVRVLALTGPSSSGKTTFTQKLLNHIEAAGKKAVMISLDHYYLNRDTLPEVDGKIDLETIHALDINRFKRDITALIETQSAKIPTFDFTTGMRTGETELSIEKDAYILIEGIHGLNPLLTDHLDKALVFKIFISPHLQMRLDDHNPMRITAVRLLRRIVRDIAFRSTDALNTLRMWESVRAGEFQWIYPFLETADFVFNSALAYEMGVLKPYAIDALKAIDRKDPHYVTANRLIKYLKYFKTVDEALVPKDSLLREFIGGLSL